MGVKLHKGENLPLTNNVFMDITYFRETQMLLHRADEVTSTLLGEGTDVDEDIVTVLVQMREDCRSIWTSLNSVLSTEDGANMTIKVPPS